MAFGGNYPKSGARNISAACQAAQLWGKGREDYKGFAVFATEKKPCKGFAVFATESKPGSAEAAHVARRHDVVVARAGAAAVLGDGRVKVRVPITVVPV